MRSSAAFASALLAAAVPVQGKPKCCSSTISRDVVVIGGGASGSHAAVWLRDHGKSVVVIEQKAQLVCCLIVFLFEGK